MKSTVKIFLSIMLVVTVAAAQGKFGYVDSDRVLAKSKVAEAANKQFTQYLTKLEQETAAKQRSIYEKEQDLMKQKPLVDEGIVSAEVFAQKMKEVETEYVEYQKYAQVKQNEAAQKQAELMQPIITKINEVIKQIAESESYDMIFDSKMGVLFAKPAYDLTEKVIVKLNAAK